MATGMDTVGTLPQLANDEGSFDVMGRVVTLDKSGTWPWPWPWCIRAGCALLVHRGAGPAGGFRSATLLRVCRYAHTAMRRFRES